MRETESKRIRIIIVDDEDLARQRLKSLLARRSDFEIVAECSTGADAVRAIVDLKPDVVLLDVQMPELDGFDVINEVGADKMPAVIFVTAFDDFAVDAFEVGAVDYILKPVDEDRFNSTLDRAVRRMAAPAPDDASQRLTQLIQKLTSVTTSAQRFAIKVQGKILFLDPSEIYWIQAKDDVARVHLVDSAYDVREPLSHLEGRLPGTTFLRVHRSVIVNTTHVRAAEPFDQGDQLLILRNGKRITSGRSYRKAVQDFLKGAV